MTWLCDDDNRCLLFAKELKRTGTKKSLLKLLRNPYSKRLWIVQEILLASHVRLLTNGNVCMSRDAMRVCFRTGAWSRELTISALKALVASDLVTTQKYFGL